MALWSARPMLNRYEWGGQFLENSSACGNGDVLSLKKKVYWGFFCVKFVIIVIFFFLNSCQTPPFWFKVIFLLTLIGMTYFLHPFCRFFSMAPLFPGLYFVFQWYPGNRVFDLFLMVVSIFNHYALLALAYSFWEGVIITSPGSK